MVKSRHGKSLSSDQIAAIVDEAHTLHHAILEARKYSPVDSKDYLFLTHLHDALLIALRNFGSPPDVDSHSNRPT